MQKCKIFDTKYSFIAEHSIAIKGRFFAKQGLPDLAFRPRPRLTFAVRKQSQQNSITNFVRQQVFQKNANMKQLNRLYLIGWPPAQEPHRRASATITVGTLCSVEKRSSTECRCYNLIVPTPPAATVSQRWYRQCFRTAAGSLPCRRRKGAGSGVSPRDHYAKGEKEKAGSVCETCRQWWGRVPESQALCGGLARGC